MKRLSGRKVLKRLHKNRKNGNSEMERNKTKTNTIVGVNV